MHAQFYGSVYHLHVGVFGFGECLLHTAYRFVFMMEVWDFYTTASGRTIAKFIQKKAVRLAFNLGGNALAKLPLRQI